MQAGEQVGVDLLRGVQVVDQLLAVPDLDRGVPVAAGQVPLATVERQRHGVVATAHVRDQGVARRLGAAGRLDLAGLGEAAARVGHLLVELAAAHLGLVERLTEVRDASLEVGELGGDVARPGVQVGHVVGAGGAGGAHQRRQAQHHKRHRQGAPHRAGCWPPNAGRSE